MRQKPPIFPEDVLIATFHQVGKNNEAIRIPNDQRLAKIFNDAATQFGGVFRRFAWNPLYKHSTLLSDALQHIDLGGAIVRENAPTPKMYFTIAARTISEYGQGKLNKLSKRDRDAVSKIARRISDAFDQPSKSAEADREGRRRQSAKGSPSLV
ncbi:MAG TPA: hypothetical protein VN541_02880 [Tepidisphaeraceae bacterium]|nr:hypothetical protein [Tepidisphaeraceae bacterium]